MEASGVTLASCLNKLRFMKYSLKAYLSGILLFFKCLQGQSQTFENLDISSDDGLEIVTWNIEWFPKNNSTPDYVQDILLGIGADIYAIQEIDDTTVFKNTINELEDYEYILMDGWFGGLVYVYNTEQIEVLEAFEIYTSSEFWNPLPRSPLVLRFLFQGEEVYAINNHFKCCGDNYINLNNENDEEMRRLIASTLIEEYMSEELENKRVILLGDLNDMIDELPSTNVFTPFLNSPNQYWFADTEIALGPSSGWSYPTWPSHLDHILVTDEIFSDLEAPTTEVSVIDIASEMGGWYNYENNVSDHRPVAMSIQLSPLTVQENSLLERELVGVYDVLGRPAIYSPGKVLIYRYSDGSALKRISFSTSQPE